MPNLKILPIASPKLPPKSGLGNFARRSPMAETQRKKTVISAFHQLGSSVKRIKNDKMSNGVFGSINAVIKSKQSSAAKAKDDLTTNPILPPDQQN